MFFSLIRLSWEAQGGKIGAALVRIDHTSALLVIAMVSFSCPPFVPKSAFRIISLAEVLSTDETRPPDAGPPNPGRRGQGEELTLGQANNS